MRRAGKRLCSALAFILAGAMMAAACVTAEAATRDLRTGGAAEEGAEPGYAGNEVVTYSHLLPAGIAAQQQGEALTAQELAEIRRRMDSRDIGFFGTVFERPEEVDWSIVLSSGAGISCTNRSIREAYEEVHGPVKGRLVSLREHDIRAYVRRKTGTDYALARKPVQVWTDWRYLPGSDIFCIDFSGDEEEIAFTAGSRDGDLYRLQYTAAEKESGRVRDFVMTVRIDRSGRWTFLSNVRADAPAPLLLADIRFLEDLDRAAEEAEKSAGGMAGKFSIKARDYDEPYTWFGVCVTAREDIGIEVLRTDFSQEGRYELMWDNALYPDEILYTGFLKKGECLVFDTNMPWNPGVRLNVWSGDFYGSYRFGEDNYLHLDDAGVLPADRYILGHDADAEGRGVNPKDAEEMDALLAGSWIWFDPQTLDPAAILYFGEEREASCTILGEKGEYYGEFGTILDWQEMPETQAPDIISFFAYDDVYDALPGKASVREGSVGDYRLYAEQSHGAQILSLEQSGEGYHVLEDILPGASAGAPLAFYRYEGRMTWKSAYKDLLKRIRREAAESAAENPDAAPQYYCLYDIEKNGTPELFVKRGMSEASSALEIYTFTQEAGLCRTEDGESLIGFSHASLYTAPAKDENDRGGVLIWQGHMGWAAIRMLELEYVHLSETTLNEEDLNEAWMRGEEVGYTEPEELCPGACPLPQFKPDTTLPIDLYELWFVQSQTTDPVNRATPTALDPADAYGRWLLAQSISADAKANVPGASDWPDWLEACRAQNAEVTVVPADPYAAPAGVLLFNDLFKENVLYPYTSGGLTESRRTGADLDGDGTKEGILYLAETGESTDFLRVIFHRAGDTIYAYTSVCWGSDGGAVLENGTLTAVDYSQKILCERTLFRRGESFTFPVYVD